MEIWMPIIGFDGYKVSSEGSVKRLPIIEGDTIYPERILKPSPTAKGYMRVRLGSKFKYVHRLVAEAFIPNPNAYKEVNHKDGDKSNNHLDNLEWCTRSENMLHARRTGLYKKEE